MPGLSRDAAIERAIAAVTSRITEPRTSTPGSHADALRDAGRITVAFHPDRLDGRGLTAAEGLLRDRHFLPQWVTGGSSGSRSALPGGLRDRWEREQFATDEAIAPEHRPVYGALDLLHHRHGGSPEFGSCFLVLHDDVRVRSTLSLGDSHLRPDRVGTFRAPEAIVDGLAEQAAAGRLLGQTLGTHDLLAVLDRQPREAPLRTTGEYIEVQVHGGVGLEDVIAVIADPCFAGSPTEASLRSVARTAGAAFAWHPGTVLHAPDLLTNPAAIHWVGDDDHLRDLVTELQRAAGPSRLATAKGIGRLVADLRPGPPALDGDPPRSPLQRVKHLWRLAYLFGIDAHRVPP